VRITKCQLRRIINEELSLTLSEKSKKWMGKVSKEIEGEGHDGDFKKYCGGQVDQACINKAAKKGGRRAKQANLAVNFSKAKGGGKSLTYPDKKD
jgi:hypothetical protein